MDRRKVTAFQTDWCCILHTADGAVHRPKAMPAEARGRAPQYVITALRVPAPCMTSEAAIPTASAFRERRYQLVLDETYDPYQRVAHYEEVVD